MKELEVAIVIVTYKSAGLTINSIASIAPERTTPGLILHVYIVDNNSGDYHEIAQAIAERSWMSWVTLISAPTNGGFAYGNNRALELIWNTHIPDYFYLLNPDTEMRIGAMGTLVQFLETHPDVGIVGSGIDNPDGSEWPIAFRFPNLLSELINGLETGLISRMFRRWQVPQQMSSECQPIDWVSGASMMIRPAVFSAVGGLDENYFLYFEETDFCFRAKRAGFSTWYVPQGRVMHIVGQSTKTTDASARLHRYPAYWFESRRRYFAVNLGIGYAMIIDIIAIFAHALGSIKCIALRRPTKAVSLFLRDLLHHSILRSANRDLPPIRTFRPKL